MKTLLRLFVSITVATVVGCAYNSAQEAAIIRLTGAQEVPPVTSAASGSGEITVRTDRSITGWITVTGLAAVAAHIHVAASGKSGPVIVPLVKSSNDTWSVPAGTTLSAEQYAAYGAGNLYVNVHTAAFPGGEIRGQILPPQRPVQPMTRYGY